MFLLGEKMAENSSEAYLGGGKKTKQTPKQQVRRKQTQFIRVWDTDLLCHSSIFSSHQREEGIVP